MRESRVKRRCPWRSPCASPEAPPRRGLGPPPRHGPRPDWHGPSSTCRASPRGPPSSPSPFDLSVQRIGLSVERARRSVARIGLSVERAGRSV